MLKDLNATIGLRILIMPAWMACETTKLQTLTALRRTAASDASFWIFCNVRGLSTMTPPSHWFTKGLKAWAADEYKAANRRLRATCRLFSSPICLFEATISSSSSRWATSHGGFRALNGKHTIHRQGLTYPWLLIYCRKRKEVAVGSFLLRRRWRKMRWKSRRCIQGTQTHVLLGRTLKFSEKSLNAGMYCIVFLSSMFY